MSEAKPPAPPGGDIAAPAGTEVDVGAALAQSQPRRDRPPTSGDVEAFRFPDHHRSTLPNGATLLAAHAPRGPLLELGLLFPAGAERESTAEAGLATLLGGMLDEGTAELSALEIAGTVEALGGRLSSGADWDAGSLALQVLSRHRRQALELLVGLATGSTLPSEELERQRRRRLAELLRKSTHPAHLASQRFSHTVYGDTPYGHGLLGDEATVEVLDRDQLADFYQRCYPPSSAILVAAGDLDPETLAAEAAEILGGLSSGEAPPTPRIVAPPAHGRRLEIVDRPKAAQTELRIGHAGVRRGHPDYLALGVLNAILGGKFTSRINLNLRERNGYTYGAHSAFVGRRGPGPFLVQTAVATPVAVAAAREVLGELERIVAEPVEVEELADAQSYIIGTFPYSLQTVSGVVDRLENLALYDLPDDYYDTLPGRVRAVTREELLRVAREHIRPDELVIVAVGPEAELEAEMAALLSPTAA